MRLKPIKNLHTFVKICVLGILFLLFVYFRINPIYYQTVAYTYDQGRDFLRTAEIVQTKHLTFIGPTTGIMGLFHGAWWYYILVIPYILFGGWPQGFYYGVLALHIIALVLFTIFLNKRIGFWATFLFLLIVSVSPYFIKTSVFAANNTLTPIAILFFLFALFQFFQTKKKAYAYLIALSLGLILETELSFGIYLIPSFLLMGILFNDFRKFIAKPNSIFFFLFFLFVSSVPRMLFEIKNRFLQTKTFMTYLLNPTSTNPQSLSGAFFDRLRFFESYFLSVFYEYSKPIAFLVLITAILGIFLFWKKYKHHEKHVITFLSLLILMIFALSLTNRNNFFWENYLEGLQYIFLFVLILGLRILQKIKKLSLVLYGLILLFLFLNVSKFRAMVTDKKGVPSLGLRADVATVNYLYEQNKDTLFCVRVYTPPVIPYTYNYLFSYYASIGYVKPSEGFINRSCWYIFDKEPYQFRVNQWRKDNIPEKAVLKKKIMMKNETAIELWEEPKSSKKQGLY